ncbi:hypothetical protein L227DRAFT_51616 [Lentinus tigrinus ALCF2SS1-6]|uniref:Myosin tail domain-containing protein n=1 Tax=Lentinus tigrinus ALCF2SS1-6 TaxID=1328759 RepID=A0A5C2SED0_9APHY|nr:hypothetical protein L227DRAFT_51616 [Lentinus tigrinus ALCF2SS1-6]
MWSKISSALKRPETPAQDFDADDRPVQTVLSTVFDRHPNLSNFHDPNEVPFPSPSPPASPSKHGRRGIFKRTAKTISESDQVPNLPIKLSIPHLKKVKSSLHGSTASDASSISRASTDSTQPRQSQDSIRPHLHDPPARTPITPTAEGRFGSLRSILRDSNTPATGQSVRFFSRDAYKIITPDISNASASGSEPEPASFGARIKTHSSTPVRPALQDVFSPTLSSNLKLLPPPNDSNIFDLSQDIDLPPIPISKDSVPLLDNAIELPSDADSSATALRIEPDGEFRSSTPSKHDRSQSFSFGQTVFHSIGAAVRDSPASNASSSSSRRGSLKPKGNRNRAYSDTVFHSMLQAPLTPQKENVPPEADIDDRSNGALVLYPAAGSPEKGKEKDPFGAHSTAYYTPGTGVPPTPPQAVQVHGRKASREEDLILSLRTQLALQTELCAQYEVDLRGKDEMMRIIQSRFDECGRECERRKNVIRGWRKRVADLERCVQNLQLEVERSREESMERSVMDEASGYALRALHGKMEALEREKIELEKRERSAVEELQATRDELYGTKEELSRRDEAERELKDGIARARETMESMDVSMSLEEGERSRVFSTAAWDEERKALTAANEALRAEQLTLETQLTDAREDALNKDNELSVLKAELEAQWCGTEAQSEKMAELEKEKQELREEVEALNARISEMEVEWTQSENRKNELEAEAQELWATKEDLENERSELEEQLRAEQEHSEELTAALREREDKVTALEQEHKFALDRAQRVEARLREREAELSDLMKKQSERENDAENAQSEIAKMKREHARIVNEQSRTLQDVVAREVEARASMEAMVREKAETDVQINSLKDRTNALNAEVEKLRRQVHELQQESADKDIKLVQFTKQRAQDKEDLNGLNIALDSKQQELELLKRRMNVRGTAGGTPAPTAKVPASRRESSIFGTPSVATRPPSVLSDAGSTTKDRRTSETPSTITKPALGRSIRANGPTSASGSHTAKRSLDGAMGPPPSVTRSQSATAATPTRIPSGPSARATPSTIKAVANTRRMSASILDSSKLRQSTTSQERFQKLERLPSVSSASEPEKENSAPSSTSSLNSSTASSTAKTTRRMSAMPA